MQKPECFQQIILLLQSFWSDKGCVILQPYDLEVGAGTFHPATTLRSLGPDHWSAAYVQPCRRPSDGRYGDSPNRLQHYYQFQVVMKPSPIILKEMYLESLKVLGIDNKVHDIRFVEDDWESPTLGAWGLGWEVWCDGMEISQFTYFQQVGGHDCKPITGEITYGLERLAMFILECDSVMNLPYNSPNSQRPLKYSDIFLKAEKQYSEWNFNVANTEIIFRHFDDAEKMCQEILGMGDLKKESSSKKNILVQPAYDQCIKASHLFNVLDSRGVISTAQRQVYIGRVRALAKLCADA
ncbi:MAG: glycine--tRNA ligase subunit alpha, partial [Pseudomonadota bacterium]|nr:glycine--tRNA ligase subunit alpha [Pseudomonadota bacterium]